MTAQDSGNSSAGCPDLEQLAAYVDGAMGAAERHLLHRHLATCDKCPELVAEVVLVRDAVLIPAEGTPLAQPDRRWRIWAALGTAAAAAVVVLAFQLPGTWQLNGRNTARVPDALVAALDDHRTYEGRLSEFPYRPFRTIERGSGGVRNLSLVAAAGQLQQEAERQPSAGALHAWGVAQLVLGEYDGAVETIELAWLESPRNAVFAADLAAARLARAGAAARPDDLPRALEAAELALELDRENAAALFTRAVVLEKLGMRRQARDAWEQYLRVDSSSQWSTEARSRQAHIGSGQSQIPWSDVELRLVDGTGDAGTIARAVEISRSDMRDLILRVLLPRWASAAGVGTPAPTILASAVAALEAETPDRMLSDTINEVERFSGSRRRALVSGIESLGAALGAESAERPAAEIRDHLVRASTHLGDAGSQLEAWAQLSWVRHAALLQRHEEVRDRGDRLLAALGSNRWPAVAGRTHWVMGMSAFASGEWADAAHHYRESLRLCDIARERAIASSVHLNASVLARFLGDWPGAWAHRARASELLPLHRHAQEHAFLATGAATASSQELPRAALLFQTEVVLAANERAAPGPMLEAHLARARMLTRGGHQQRALADLAASEELLSAVGSDAMARRLSRALLVGSAEVRLASDPDRAVIDARQALSMIEEANEPTRAAEAYLLHARALSAGKEWEGARASIHLGINAFERALSSIDYRDPVRMNALQPSWALYTEAGRLHLKPGAEDHRAAFALMERGRALALREAGHLTPVTLRETQQRLGPEEAVLVMDQSSGALTTWWITRTTVTTASHTLTANMLQRLVALHQRSINRDIRRHWSSAELFDAAFGHWRGHLRKTSVLAVIADSEWNKVAWPALWDRQTDQELVELTAAVLAPSVAVAVNRVDRPRHRAALIVSAPDAVPDRTLSGARDEAADLLQVYTGARLLEGAAATPDAFRQWAPGAGVIHVASHGVDVPNAPHLSHLVLGSRERSVRLTVSDVMALDLSQTGIVVLAACSTTGVTAVRGAGMQGLAWGFLMAGAHQVVATRQAIEDGPARQLFRRFHERLAAGESAARALHGVQQDLARAGESPRLWAAIAVFGAL